MGADSGNQGDERRLFYKSLVRQDTGESFVGRSLDDHGLLQLYVYLRTHGFGPLTGESDHRRVLTCPIWALYRLSKLLGQPPYLQV